MVNPKSSMSAAARTGKGPQACASTAISLVTSRLSQAQWELVETMRSKGAGMRSMVRWYAGALLAVAVLSTARPGAACVGDCAGDGQVTIDDLILTVNIALGTSPLSECTAADGNGDSAVTINDVVTAVNAAQAGCALGPAGEVLVSLQGFQLDEYDLGTGTHATVVPSTHARVSGQPCLLPGESGEYVVGDSTGAPAVPPGWSVFSPDGTFLRRLPLPAGTSAGRVPVGCVVDPQGRLFATRTGADGDNDGQLIVYLPPDYQRSCILDMELRTPGFPAVDDAGEIYVPEGGRDRVLRFGEPFPSETVECGSVGPAMRPFIRTGGLAPRGIARGNNGHWFVSAAAADGTLPRIYEYTADGIFVRGLFPPGSGGNPTGLAVDSVGTLYYADDSQLEQAPGRGTLRMVTFDTAGAPAAPRVIARGLDHPGGLAVFRSRAAEWLTLGGSVRRTYFNPRNRQINVGTVPALRLKWRYLTGGMISAQPAVTWIDLPGEGRTQVVIVSSWDHYVYALRADNGSRVWRYLRKPQPGTFYPFAGSPTIAWIGGQQRVYVPGGETMYCLDATSGEEIWQFDAGTGCTDCTARTERNQIEATPAVVNGLVIAGMDVNDNGPGKGGVFALHADDGRLAWFFDVMTGSTCRTLPEDDVRRFDAYHTAAELGLPEDFFATRPGCDFDRTSATCGNVWSSPAIDLRRGQLFIASSNCDTDDDPETPAPPPPMPPYDEAIFSLTLDGDPVWVWRPREVDNDDLAFGAVPNLFEAEIGGDVREVIGIGNKDGTYYVLDRDGTNELTGVIEPYWQTNVVPGGPAGGMIGAASVGEGIVAVATAPGFSPFQPQKPSVHAFDAGSGEIVWQFSDTDAAFGPTMGVPGLVITGGTPRPNLNFFTRDDGELLRPMPASTVPGGIAGGPTLVGSMVFVGGGTGAFNEGSQAEGEARRDTPLSAFCVEGTPECTPNTCDDGNICTYDYRDRNGVCVSEPGAEDVRCQIGAENGDCVEGVCIIP